MWRRLYGSFAVRDTVLAALALVLFVAALVSGQGLKSFAFLGAALFWAALGRYTAGKARHARRQERLRARRLAEGRRRPGE